MAAVMLKDVIGLVHAPPVEAHLVRRGQDASILSFSMLLSPKSALYSRTPRRARNLVKAMLVSVETLGAAPVSVPALKLATRKSLEVLDWYIGLQHLLQQMGVVDTDISPHDLALRVAAEEPTAIVDQRELERQEAEIFRKAELRKLRRLRAEQEHAELEERKRRYADRASGREGRSRSGRRGSIVVRICFMSTPHVCRIRSSGGSLWGVRPTGTTFGRTVTVKTSATKRTSAAPPAAVGVSSRRTAMRMRERSPGHGVTRELLQGGGEGVVEMTGPKRKRMTVGATARGRSRVRRDGAGGQRTRTPERKTVAASGRSLARRVGASNRRAMTKTTAGTAASGPQRRRRRAPMMLPSRSC